MAVPEPIKQIQVVTAGLSARQERLVTAYAAMLAEFIAVHGAPPTAGDEADCFGTHGLQEGRRVLEGLLSGTGQSPSDLVIKCGLVAYYFESNGDFSRGSLREKLRYLGAIVRGRSGMPWR